MAFNKTFVGDKIPKTTKWLYASSGFFREGFFQFISMFLLIFAQYCGIGKMDNPNEYIAMYGVISVIIIVLKIWDGINDPILGYFLEKSTRLRKFGKYRPWLFIGCLSSSIVALLMFWLPLHGWLYVIFFGVLFFLFDFTFSMNDVAFWGLLPSLSSNEKIRAGLTSLLSLFVSLGALTTGFLAPLLSKLLGYAISYRVFSLIASILFVSSQIILVVFMKERKEQDSQVQSSQKMKLKDIFSVLLKNGQLRTSIVAILLYYIGSSVMLGLALNFFYFNYGYSKAIQYQMIFLGVCSVAMVLAEVMYQLTLSKLKIKKRNALILSGLIVIICYLGMFFLFLKEPEEIFWLFCVLGFFIIYFQTTVQVSLFINIQDCIDYNEYKFGDRREASIFSLRALSAKVASGLTQLIVFLILMFSGLLSISNQISGYENQAIATYGADAEKVAQFVQSQADAITGASNVELWQRMILQAGFCLIPLGCFIGCILVMGAFYHIDERKHEQILAILKKRHEQEKTKEESL